VRRWLANYTGDGRLGWQRTCLLQQLSGCVSRHLSKILNRRHKQSSGQQTHCSPPKIYKKNIYDDNWLLFQCFYFLVQCVVLGDGGVGKTSLLMSYAQDRFPDDYTATGESILLINEGTLQTQIP
jgi:hypothetical protein